MYFYCPNCQERLKVYQNFYKNDSPYGEPITIWKCPKCKIEIIEILDNNSKKE